MLANRVQPDESCVPHDYADKQQNDPDRGLRKSRLLAAGRLVRGRPVGQNGPDDGNDRADTHDKSKERIRVPHRRGQDRRQDEGHRQRRPPRSMALAIEKSASAASQGHQDGGDYREEDHPGSNFSAAL
jgi:hypothetical protein